MMTNQSEKLYPMPVERSHIFDSVMALCDCGTRFWPRDKHDTKCYGCQTEEAHCCDRGTTANVKQSNRHAQTSCC